jgi:hypothetical protein
MSNPTTLPAADTVVAVAGVVPPLNPFQKALHDALVEAKKELTSPAVEKTVVTGVFGFLAVEFPVIAPFVGLVEQLILKLLGAS